MTEQPPQPTAVSLRDLLVGWRARTRPEDIRVMRGARQRAGAGVTQEQLARALGISLRHYNALELGMVRQPSFELLAGLVQVLRLDGHDRLALVDALLDAAGSRAWDLAGAC